MILFWFLPELDVCLLTDLIQLIKWFSKIELMQDTVFLFETLGTYGFYATCSLHTPGRRCVSRWCRIPKNNKNSKSWESRKDLEIILVTSHNSDWTKILYFHQDGYMNFKYNNMWMTAGVLFLLFLFTLVISSWPPSACSLCGESFCMGMASGHSS